MPAHFMRSTRMLTMGLIGLFLALTVALPVLASPLMDPGVPENQVTDAALALPASITYDIFQLAAGRTPASNLYCDTGGAVYYGAETKGVAPGYLGRIDATGQITEWAYGMAPISMVKDNNDRMWTADFEGTQIGRLAPRSNRLTTWETGYTHLHGIAYNDSIIWTASRDGFVLRFKPGTGELRVFAMPANTPLKHSLMDSQGRLWIAAGDQAGAGAAVFMFDKATRKFTRYQLPAGFNPWGIREAADGAIWFSNFNLKNQTGNPVVIARFDPATLQWTSFGGYPRPHRTTSMDWLGNLVIGVNILGDEFFLFDPSTAGETVTLTKTITQGVVREVKTLTPVGQTLTPIIRTVPRTTGASTGAAASPYTIYSVPNPIQIHSLFGVKVCDNHVWMSGLLADQLYHFVGMPAPTLTPTAVRTTTSTPTRTLTATPTPTLTRTPSPTAITTATSTPALTRTSTPTQALTRTPTPTQAAPATSTPTITPTSTSTPTPASGGAVELAPAADATINAWNPDTNFGGSTALMLRQGFVSALLRFDLSALPAGAAITQAELSVYTINRTNEQALTAVAYRILRGWDESQVTANVARTGQPWSAQLANGAGDREATALASVPLPGSGWAALDVTAAARSWMSAGPAGNFGLLLQATSADLVQYSLASREGWPTDQRPKLIVRYTLAAPDDIPSLTP